MGRFNLVYRRISSSGRNLPKDFIEKIKNHLNLVQEAASRYEPSMILGFDESSFYMDAVGNYSIETKGTFVKLIQGIFCLCEKRNKNAPQK